MPCGPINTIDRVFGNEQVQHRQMSFNLTHPTLGDVPQVANPVKFSQTPIVYTDAPPILGEHTDAVLSKLKR